MSAVVLMGKHIAIERRTHENVRSPEKVPLAGAKPLKIRANDIFGLPKPTLAEIVDRFNEIQTEQRLTPLKLDLDPIGL